MDSLDPTTLDPRIRRTRLLLQKALVKLMRKKSFDEISVQDLTEEATLNRATFYAHYPDKFGLLKCTTDTRLNALLEERGVTFDGTCNSALRRIFLGVCDYLAAMLGRKNHEDRPLDPHMESAIIEVVRSMSLEGLKQQQPWHGSLSQEMVATILSCALYGAAKEWILTPQRGSAEAIADGVVDLLVTMIHPRNADLRPSAPDRGVEPVRDR